MDSAAEILVIILAVVLAIFLALAIGLTIILIKITSQIKQITGTAQRAVDNIERTTTNMSRMSVPVMLSRFAGQVAGKLKQTKK